MLMATFGPSIMNESSFPRGPVGGIVKSSDHVANDAEYHVSCVWGGGGMVAANVQFEQGLERNNLGLRVLLQA